MSTLRGCTQCYRLTFGLLSLQCVLDPSNDPGLPVQESMLLMALAELFVQNIVHFN